MTTNKRIPAFLLGAGASVDAGLPISTEITQKLIDSISTAPNRNREAAALNLVVAAIIHHDSRTGGRADALPDIERVASAVELLAQRSELEIAPFVSDWDPALIAIEASPMRTPPFMENDLMDALGWKRGFTSRQVSEVPRPDGRRLVRAIEKLVSAHTKNAREPVFEQLLNRLVSGLIELLTPQAQDAFDYLRPLIDIAAASAGPVLVGTLNYDLGVETVGARFNCPVNRGIETWASEGSLSLSDQGINLPKLHGSVDWFRTVYQSGNLTAATLTTAYPQEGWGGPIPFLVFGQREKLRAAGPFLELLESFRRELGQAQDLVVIGCAFRDGHVNELIARWFNTGTDRRLTVVDPYFPSAVARWNLGDFRTELLHLAKTPYAGSTDEDRSDRINIVRETASDFLRSLPRNDPSSRLDQLFDLKRAER